MAMKCQNTKKNNKTLLEIASINLNNNYLNKIIKPTNKFIKQSLDIWLTKKLQNAKKHNIKLNKNDLKEEYNLYKLRIEKNYYKNNFENDISDNIIEFKKLGLELTVGWVRTNE